MTNPPTSYTTSWDTTQLVFRSDDASGIALKVATERQLRLIQTKVLSTPQRFGGTATWGPEESTVNRIGGRVRSRKRRIGVDRRRMLTPHNRANPTR